MRQPIIGIPCDVKTIGLYPFHAVGEKYITAAVGAAGGVAILIPALGDAAQLETIVDLVDGVLLPGSPSNVEPHHYRGEPSRPGTLHDVSRDATTLPLIRLLVERGVPLLGICRGFQEMNVALGGELHQHVQEQPGLADHREPDVDDVERKYGLAHEVNFAPGSCLAAWLGRDSARVNSLHQQGIRRLADGLQVEATAHDGLVEAYRVADAPGFAYAVQWHPEWKYWEQDVSQAIFKAFGDACRKRRQQR